MATLFCKLFGLGDTCSGTVKLFTGALKFTGEQNACRLVKLCSGKVNPFEGFTGLSSIKEILSGTKNSTKGEQND
ncbi:hypothetical protein NECAME_00538 [Necator americanus]|uniref:Uncharacterized protein n=1 Tax=Necator americanus TaxID=51031 RepID=W2T7N8_NECAM|nr:hypothetical protein NECAME_00538 [Necator americanus]ETN77012.1 hypothetical protein NECAME_00538 [Necator americanus]